eukprot:GHVR01190475.1.p1 GENE.GHVR01190475.1~~GHVR01190475.1.p1  ORF type:complete len:162 (-),score=53.67 GHVR01190475.1:170-655(-)
MLHDILLALLGIPGDIFILKLIDGDPLEGRKSRLSFGVNESLTFLTTFEREVLSRLAAIGGDFLAIQNFINNGNIFKLTPDDYLSNELNTCEWSLTSNTCQWSLTWMGIRSRLNTICDGYREVVSKLEREILILGTQVILFISNTHTHTHTHTHTCILQKQ